MDVMDVANLSMSMSQSKLMTDIGIAVLDKALDTFESQSSEMTKLLESAAQPNLGQSFDSYI